MAEEIGPCKLDQLTTTFSPGRITLHVELVPQEGQEFDAPMTEPGKKLGMIANYARGIFQVSLRERKNQRKQ